MELTRMRILRKDKDRTMKQIADDLGIDESYYSLVETGKRKPSDDLAEKISKYYGHPWEKLVAVVQVKA